MMITSYHLWDVYKNFKTYILNLPINVTEHFAYNKDVYFKLCKHFSCKISHGNDLRKINFFSWDIELEKCILEEF